MAEPTKLPDINIGRKEPTGQDKKNTQAKRVAWNKDVHKEGQTVIIEVKGGNEIKSPKQWADNKAQEEANRLGMPVKVKLTVPKKGGGGGGGSSPREPSAPSSTTPGSGYPGNNVNSNGINMGAASQSIKDIESYGGNYNARAKTSTASGAYQFIRDTWRKASADAGYGGMYRDAADAPPQVQDAVFNKFFSGLIRKNGINGAINEYFTGNAAGNMTDAQRRANPRETAATYQNKFWKGYNKYLNRFGGESTANNAGGGGGGGGGGGEEVIESKEQKPEGRDDDINKRAVKKDEGDTDEAKKLRKPPSEKSKRGDKGFSRPVEGTLGIQSEEGEGTDGGATTGNSFIKDQFNDFKGGIPRELTAQIPPMESLLMGIPESALNQFVGQLPGPLQGLIPPGLVSGISGNSPVSLNGLMQLVGGGALGQAAGQIIRSTNSGGIPLVTNPQVPNSNSAILANSLGTISKVSTNRAASGIPVDLTTLTRSIQLVLRSSSNNVAIPTNVLGIAGQVASQALGAIINQALGGLFSGLNIPILPSNLSIPNAAVISGLSQFLPPGIAQNIFTVGQVTGLLPGNLQNQIPTVPTSVYSGGVPNSIGQNRLASPDVAPGTGYPGKDGSGMSGGSGNNGGSSFNGKTQEGVKVQTEDGRSIPYQMMISKYLTLDQVTRNVLINRGKHKLVPHMNYTIDQLIEHLSAVAKNCYDPLHEQFGPAHVNSGFRENSGTDHGRGMALDISFEGNHARLFEIAKWASQNLPYKQIILERQKTSWLHIAYDKSGAKAGRPLMTQLPGGQGENSRYTGGLVNLYGNR